MLPAKPGGLPWDSRAASRSLNLGVGGARYLCGGAYFDVHVSKSKLLKPVTMLC